jgi:arylsulfatase A-like enzyme
MRSSAAAILLALAIGTEAAAAPHNAVLFVPDGLRALMVTRENAPEMAALAAAGVTFTNTHSLFPTFTTPNASAMATGHFLGDTGDFSNTIDVGYKVPGAGGTLTPFLESDPILGDVDEHFHGDYLSETTLLAMARAVGFATVAVGKVGPTLIFDHTERTGARTVVIDDQTGSKNGIPLAPWVADGIAAAGLAPAPPSRGANGKPGTLAANVEQQDWFMSVVTKVLLPKLKADGKPFVLVFWSRDPDGTQHNQGDSLGKLTPGINGPTSLAGIRNADDDLRKLRAALAALDLAATTDIVVSADHGFSTISKESRTSAAAKASYQDVPAGLLPPGFLALDLAARLKLPLFDPDDGDKPVAAGTHPRLGNGLLGDPGKPRVVVAANGGSDLIYLPKPVAPGLAGRIVAALLAEDYVGGVFADEALGRIPGALPLGAVGLKGSAVTPLPAIAVTFRTFTTGCAEPTTCQAEIADTGLQQGQGMHGSFGRGDTRNFMAAIGPDFKAGFIDDAAVGNADIGQTLVRLIGLKRIEHGHLTGRILSEALVAGKPIKGETKLIRSDPTADGLETDLSEQIVGGARYFDAAGIPGRMVGIDQTR